MIEVFQTKVPKSIVSYLETKRGKLSADVSNYARGRNRAWIGVEGPLSPNFPFKAASFTYSGKLWKWLSQFCVEEFFFEPELGLVHLGGTDCQDPDDRAKDGRGGECGIRKHRDAGFCSHLAVGINLSGTATFGYEDETGKLTIVPMRRGTCVMFNCKHIHYAQASANRWAINAWRISDKRRADYNQFISPKKKGFGFV